MYDESRWRYSSTWGEWVRDDEDAVATAENTSSVTSAIPDQPDGIDTESHDLPDPVKAAERIGAYLREFGDGLYNEVNGKPLYGRDLEAVTRAVAGRVVVEHPLVSLAVAERGRQIGRECWFAEHDDKHVSGELAQAAAAYAAGDVGLWPWERGGFKLGPDRRRELVKAVALLLAEWDRLDRAARLVAESGPDRSKGSLAARLAQFGVSGHIRIGSPESVQDGEPQ